MTNRLTALDGLILTGLSGLLLSVYLFTFSGRYISDDELFLIDTAESLARRGSVLLTETGALMWPGETQVEPLQPVLTAPLFWLSSRLPFVGNVHGIMLFNPLVTVGTAGLVYLFTAALHYPRRVALAAALAFGLATIAWPYTKNFFREPLTGLMLLATAYLLLRWRQAVQAHDRRAAGWLLGVLGVGGLSALTKDAALIALPVFVTVFVPWSTFRSLQRREVLRTAAAITAALVLLGVGLWIYQDVLKAGLGRYTRFSWWGVDEGGILVAGAWPALVGPFFSPGKSLFLYSPICALAVAPLVTKPAAGQRRFDAAWPLLLLVVFAVAYAIARGELWWGGTGWGPRYMVPLTPFLVIAASPVFEFALRAGGSFPARLGLAALLTLSLLVQIAGVSVFPLDYYDELEKIGAAAAWTVGLWDPLYSAIVTHWRLIGAGLPDFAWARARAAGPDWISGWLIAVTGIGFAGLLVWAGRRASRPVTRRAVLAAGFGGLVVLTLLTGFALVRIYPDRRYRGDDAGLQAMRAYWEHADKTLPDKALFLNNRTYFDFVLNYVKDDAPFYSIPYSPGDQSQPGATPPPPSTDPRTLVFRDAHSIVDYFPKSYRTVGLLMESGPYHAGIVRSVEWWMAETYYHIGTAEFAPDVRLVSFSTARAPAFTDPPAHAVGARFGQAITLVGYDAQPAGPAIAPGATLNISVQWQASTAPGDNFTASVDLISPEGALVLQHDSYPVAGFWPTSAFVPGQPVRDNVAFVLPRSLPPGRYHVWALMYDSAVRRLSVTDAEGRPLGDHVVLLEVEVRDRLP